MSLIKTEKLTCRFKRYDNDGNIATEDTALSDINIDIEQGSYVAILGKNGSGKSTFARHLNALLLPTEGVVWIGGEDTAKAKDLFEIRKTVGMVFQNPDNQIVSSIIDEDVAFGPENLGVPKEEMEKRVYNSLEKVGMSEFADRSPNKLSGGQKQRVAIAGILAMKPKAIVLDEATAMLDPLGRKEVLQTLKKLHEDEGITLITITHHMEEAVFADRVMVINASELVMDGTVQEVFRRGEELYKYGLRLPDTIALRLELEKRGIKMPDVLALTEEELADQIAALVG